MTSSPVIVTYRSVFIRWLPLAFSWALMSLELPLVQSIVSGMLDSRINLAALGIVFAACLMCESPILMLVSASAALVKDWESYRKLRNFALTLSCLMSGVFAIVTLLLRYSGVLLMVSNNDQILADRVFDACLLSLVVPFVVGNRRFHQGVLICSGRSYLLTVGTFTRLFLIIACGFLLSHFSSLNGALVGAAAGVAGMMGESLVITILGSETRKLLKSDPQESQALQYSGIFKFYMPLAISGVVNLSILPVLTFFMSQAPQPVNSLAGYQVFQGIVFFLSSFALGMQEVVVSMVGPKQQGYRILRNSCLCLAFFVGAIFAVYVLSPLSHLVLLNLVGIPEELFLFLHPALLLALPIPVLTVLAVAMRGMVVAARRTRWVTAASATELIMVLSVMAGLTHWGAYSGLCNAIIALFSARLASCLVLTRIFAALRSEFRFVPTSA